MISLNNLSLVECKNKVKTKRNLDENIEPDRIEKFVNINSSEDFKPGIHKEQNQSANHQEEQGWSFWKTLKNPLNWLGIGNQNPKEDYLLSDEISQGTDSSRNRSASHNLYTKSSAWVQPSTAQPFKNTQKYEEAFLRPSGSSQPNKYDISKSLRYAREL